MVPFAGFDMPVSYRGIMEEHQAVRNHVGIFDISHMGVMKVQGPGAEKFLDRMLTKPVSKVAVGRGAYALLCKEDGNPLDDLIFYRTAEEIFYLALNASNKDKDLAWLQSHLANPLDAKVEMTEMFDDHALFAIQGKEAGEFLKSVGVDLNFSELYSTRQAKFAGVECLFFVSGYSGETGCEVSVPNANAREVFQSFLDRGRDFQIQPVGLGARDTLRTEMGYSLYGHELSDSINPVEAGIGWAVDFSGNFIGSEALRRAKENPRRRLISFQNVNSKQAPRAEMKIFDSSSREVGRVTSGTYSPTLGWGIGMGLVESKFTAPITVEIRGQQVPYEIVKRPFYKKNK